MADGVFIELVRFFKSARHLWGRCPQCGELFRLSDAAISFGSAPPRDWLLRLQRQRDALNDRAGDLEDREASVAEHEDQVRSREREVETKERRIEHTARAIAQDMLRSEATVKALVKEARAKALQRSRSTRLGKLFERLAPFSKRLGHHDPRDMRAIMDPIDFVVFNGLTVNRRVDHITFIEVKSGRGRESACQRSIADAIQRGNLDVETLQIGAGDLPLEHQLLRAPKPE